jgi:selenocysteine lyase/cysteine desulfurase
MQDGSRVTGFQVCLCPWLLYAWKKPHYISMDENRLQRLIDQQFPSLRTMVYANHAAISPWARVTQEAVQDFATEICELGPLRAGQWLTRESGLRNRIAGMLNAPSGEDVALLKNTTEGICMVTNGIDWQPGDNLVTPASEFVSNQMAWDRMAGRGVEIRKVDILGSDDPERDLLDCLDQRTRVLTVSAVQWDSGFRLDLEKLGDGCRDEQCLFFVDAIQQIGALKTDVQASGIDVLCASAHKWQMGPEGIAIFYCNEATRQTLELSQYGWRMLDDPYRFNRPDREPSATARRFEAGSPNTMGQAALFASLGLLEEVGFDEVERRILENTQQMTRAFRHMAALELRSSPVPERHSGIVCFEPLNKEPESVRRKLSKSGCFAAVRGSAVRISPHFYQHGQAVERLLNAIEDAI